MEDFLYFDIIVPMTRIQEKQLTEMAPQNHHADIRLLSDFAPEPGSRDVSDPLGRGLAAYEDALSSIKAGITGLLRWIETEACLARGQGNVSPRP
jgi:protein-tyrosine-phosphatase